MLFLCDEKATPKQKLHDVSTMDLDRKIRACALKLQDSRILAKLRTGDLVALEASYHRSCLISFYRRVEKTHEKEEG